jgi:sulfur relay (sulfurtransferase) complex TusBCD TusD component (DsrE family)
MQFLLILNDPAYGTERSYNGFRLARTLAGQEGAEVRVFLMGDAVTCPCAIRPSRDSPRGRGTIDSG